MMPDAAADMSRDYGITITSHTIITDDVDTLTRRRKLSLVPIAAI